VRGQEIPNVNENQGSSWDHVSPGYLEAMGEHILARPRHYGARHGRGAERCRMMIARSWVIRTIRGGLQQILLDRRMQLRAYHRVYGSYCVEEQTGQNPFMR
jgi:hypothetical protein